MQHESHEVIASCPVFACAQVFTLHLINRRIVRQNQNFGTSVEYFEYFELEN